MQKKDKNGYTKSLLHTESGRCYVCGREVQTARHEVFYGPDRENSKALGMWADVCPPCHAKIHADAEAYTWLKAAAQLQFEKEFGHERFMAVFGRNYLPEEDWIIWTD